MNIFQWILCLTPVNAVGYGKSVKAKSLTRFDRRRTPGGYTATNTIIDRRFFCVRILACSFWASWSGSLCARRSLESCLSTLPARPFSFDSERAGYIPLTPGVQP